ncbi:Class E vacuolar protein-sorting machinery protein hse1 [Escovopsis weberi]|uniref:Class E vacuolar protein-sorting machinery protein HSE1 n=1 Tax=Escovopsis weberi TaxID=150374 RepID=A0A0M9VS86_ESCWE|nr:Class E vacuolar protein-sorting machinery protein hse1 [Escovopsis weberi]
MFRAASAGPFEEAVAKATDENLTSEDWAAIMEVCDKVAADPNGPKEAVQSMIRRLAHRNANVQLYTLEARTPCVSILLHLHGLLAHALCQNGGPPVHREISSRAFTDALLKLANDRNTHTQVKAKIMEKLQEWSTMFGGNPDLGIVYDAYFRLKQSNPSLQAPSAPQKQGLTSLDRQKEEEELQMALKLSLQDEERKKAAQAAAGASAGARQPEHAAASTALPSGTTAATVSRVRALFDFVPSEPGELEFKRGDVIAVLESVYKDWWRGSLKGQTGIFPLNYVEKLADPTPEELQREAQMEAEVFAEIKNVEKLLTLLSASNTTPREEDNEEISKLYHQTLAIRPKLIKLIEKYSQKKDDFTQLNEKFIKARRDYESLLESSMSHPPQHNYHQYAIRPGIQGQGPPPAGRAYPGQQPPQQAQDPQRYYTPEPGNAYQTTSPPPSNFQPYAASTQAQPGPFFLAGSEVPPTAAINQPPASQPYPAADDAAILPVKQHAAPAITASPAPMQPYSPYSQPPPQNQPGATPPYPPQPQWKRLSTHGAQELATSAYDSPIAPGTSNTPDNGVHQHQQPQQPSYQSYQPPPGPGVAKPPSTGPSAPQGGPPSEPQYTPYSVPGEGPSAPAPGDYYRQPGVY